MSETQSTITYRAIPGSPGYRVGDDGSVWSCLCRVYPGGSASGVHYEPCGEWKQLKQTAQKTYKYMTVQINQKHRLVHRLVLEAFVGPAPDGMEAAHNNGIHDDNRLSNLRWATKRDNQTDRLTHGTDCRGEKHGQHKLTCQDIVDILQQTDKGLSRAAIGRQFGIHPSTVRRIAQGLAWKHINPRHTSTSSDKSARTLPMTP